MKKRKAGIAAATVATLLIGEAFVGGIDWRNVMDLPQEHAIRVAAQSMAVGYQKSLDGVSQSRCNYWVVAPNKVMANGHCIEDGRTEGITLYFTDRTVPVLCEKMLAYSPWEAYDYLLLECEGDLPPHLDIDLAHEHKVGDELLHISHNCDYYSNSQCAVVPKYDNTRECKTTDVTERGSLDIAHGCDSLGGSSGSALLSREINENGRYSVIALHHAGAFFQDSRGSQEGRGSFNASVKIDLVIGDLKGKGIDIMALREGKDEPKTEPVEENGWVKLIKAIAAWLIKIAS